MVPAEVVMMVMVMMLLCYYGGWGENKKTATEGHVDQAVEAASTAFEYWSSLSGKERAIYLDAIAEAFKKHKEEL